MQKRAAGSLPDLFDDFSNEALAPKRAPKPPVLPPVPEVVPRIEAGPSAASASWRPSEEQFLSDKQVAARYQVSRASVWRWVSAYPDFPKPHQITPGTSRWYLSELRAHEAVVARTNSRPAK